jgi:hypothetical protein
LVGPGRHYYTIGFIRLSVYVVGMCDCVEYNGGIILTVEGGRRGWEGGRERKREGWMASIRT